MEHQTLKGSRVMGTSKNMNIHMVSPRTYRPWAM